MMRVLLIDDHALFRFGVSELLERRGIEVVDALGECEAGIERVVETAPDVVLLDLRMPRLSGLEVLKRLRQAGQTMPVAMLTTSADERDLIASLKAGAQGYLLKDMEPDELISLFPGNGECFRYRSQSRHRFWRQPFPLGKRLLQDMGKPD